MSRGRRRALRARIFRRTAEQFVTTSRDKTAKVWEVEDGSLQVTLEGHRGEVNSASFSPDGTRIVTGSGDGTANIWNAEDGIAAGVA
jgi:WD40 repeat protein